MKRNSIHYLIVALCAVCLSILSMQAHAAATPCKCVIVEHENKGAFTVSYKIPTCQNLSDPSCASTATQCNGITHTGELIACSIAQQGAVASFHIKSSSYTMHVPLNNRHILITCKGALGLVHHHCDVRIVTPLQP